MPVGRELDLVYVRHFGQNLLIQTVYDQALVGHVLIADRAIPRRLLLVHHQIRLDIETLHVFALERAARQMHTELHERTHQRDLVRGRLYLEVVVVYQQLVADHLARYLGVFDAVFPQVLDERRHAHLPEQVDAHAVDFARLRIRPVELDFVGHVGRQLAYGRDVYGAPRADYVRVRLARRLGRGQLRGLSVYVQDEVGREVVLLGRAVVRAESEVYLLGVLEAARDELSLVRGKLGILIERNFDYFHY